MRTAVAIVLSIAAGCSSSSSADDEPDATVVCSSPRFGPCGESERTYWVLDRLTIPSTQDEASELALDLDGDGPNDNLIGALLAADDSGEPSRATDDAVRRGDIIHLVELVAPDFTTTPSAGMYLYSGANPSIAPCAGDDDETCGRHLTGNAHFDVEPTGAAPFVGPIIGGRLLADFDSGETHLDIKLFASGATVRLPMVAGLVEAQISEDGIAGTIGGAVREADYRAAVFPVLAMQMNMIIAEDCQVGATCECTPGSDGETIIGVADANDDCSVTAEELIAIEQFGPDVDVLDADGQPGTDGVDDSRSFAFGFTAVRASFEP